MQHIPHTPHGCRTHRFLKAALVALFIFVLAPLWLVAQQGPPHATPAPNGQVSGEPMPEPLPPDQPGMGQPIPPGQIPPEQPGMGQPIPPGQIPPGQPGPGQPIQQLPPQPGQVVPPDGQPPVAPPIPPPAAPPVAVTPSPTAAPQVLYEGAPTTATIRGIMGAGVDQGAGAALPTAAPESPRVTVMMRQKPPEEVFRFIRDKTGVRVQSMGAVNTKPIDVMEREQPVETVLTNIATKNGWTWLQAEDGSYEMHDPKSLMERVARQTRQKVFQLHFIDAEELLKVVQPLLTPEVGAAAADARSNKLIVTDLPSKLALVDSIIREYDVQVYTHVFEIKHAAIEEIQEQLDQIKSKAGEMYIDALNRTIIVKDTFDKIKMMEQLVQILDRDVEMRVYNLMNIGLDGQFAEDFISKFIEPLKSGSESAVMDFSEATSKLFVRDVRSVHDKILQILRQIDVPRKQVRIEGEIVSVAVNHQLEIGAEWAYSHDLPGAIRTNQGGIGTETGFNTIGLPLITGGSSGLRVLDICDNVKVELTAALTDTRTRLLLRPRILIANNEQGEFNVTEDQPVLQTYNYGAYNNAQNNFSSGQMTYRSGLQVRIHPTISNRGLVEMEIEFINSTPIIVPDIGNGQRGVGSAEESANTVLVIPSGETRVIGGMISRDNTEGSSGIPWLSQIPYLGVLFGKKSTTKGLRNLMFFITPTIVEEQPLNDLIVEPVNESAQYSMKQAQQVATPPSRINEIPPELRPYLREVQPESLPMPSGDLTTGTQVGPVGEVSDEVPFTTDTPDSGSSFLLNETYTGGAKVSSELRMGGTPALTSAKGGATGPSGVFGGAGTAGGAPPRATAGAAAPGAAAGTRPGALGAAAAGAGKTAVTTPGARTPTTRPRETTRPQRAERGGLSSDRYRGGQGMSQGRSYGGSQPGTTGSTATPAPVQ